VVNNTSAGCATRRIVALGHPVLEAIPLGLHGGEPGPGAGRTARGEPAAAVIAGWLGATVFRTHDVRGADRPVLGVRIEMERRGA